MPRVPVNNLPVNTPVEAAAPTAIIDAPRTVPFGTTFTLSGAASTDVGGGSISRYIWMRID